MLPPTSPTLAVYLRMARKHWLVVLLPALIGLGVALYQQAQVVPLYRATTTLYLNLSGGSSLLPYQSTRTVESLANTYAEYMRTRSFSKLVSEALAPPVPIEVVQAALGTAFVSDTQFFRISATHADARLAQLLANTAARVLIDESSARQAAEREQLSESSVGSERDQLLALRSSLQQELELQNSRIESLEAQIAGLEALSPSGQSTARLDTLRRSLIEALGARSQALANLSQIQSTLASTESQGAGMVQETAVVVDPADLPLAPVVEGSLRALLVGLLLGGGAGAGLAYARERLDDSARDPEQVAALLERPLQALVPFVESDAAQPDEGWRHRLTATAPRSPAAESLRSLVTSLRIYGESSPLRTIVVTSAVPGEGKSFVSLNLAGIFAQYGLRTVLVDADLHRPTLHRALGVEARPGLVDLVIDGRLCSLAPLLPALEGLADLPQARELLAWARAAGDRVAVGELRRRVAQLPPQSPAVGALAAAVRDQAERGEHFDLAAYLRPVAENFWALPTGTLPPDPAAFLSGRAVPRVLAELRAFADIVIVDTPPLTALADAAILAPLSDGVLQVVSVGTSLGAVRRARAALAQVSAPYIGPVLNRVRGGWSGGYYYEYYYYYRGYDQRGESEAPRDGKRAGRRGRLGLPWLRRRAR